MVVRSWNMLMVEAHLFLLLKAKSQATTYSRKIEE